MSKRAVKRALFWVCYPFGCVVVIVAGLIGILGAGLAFLAYAIDNGLSAFESWCFND